MAIESIAWPRRSVYLYAVLLLVIVSGNFVQTEYQSKQSHLTSSCSSKTTCHDCIRAKSCVWCSQPDFGDRPRCFEPAIVRDYCKEEFEYNPSSTQEMVQSEHLTVKDASAAQAQMLSSIYRESQSTKSGYSSSNYSSHSYKSQSTSTSQGRSYAEESKGSYSHSEGGKIVQIYPQRVKLQLRISMFYFFHLKISPECN